MGGEGEGEGEGEERRGEEGEEDESTVCCLARGYVASLLILHRVCHDVEGPVRAAYHKATICCVLRPVGGHVFLGITNLCADTGDRGGVQCYGPRLVLSARATGKYTSCREFHRCQPWPHPGTSAGQLLPRPASSTACSTSSTADLESPHQ